MEKPCPKLNYDGLSEKSKALIDRRAKVLGPNISTFYEEPIHIVKGDGVWLWDADGNKYLDCYNNVPHVGHCHPKVVDAIAKQAATLNTHTRYLHEGILNYSERLTSTFDTSLSSVIMACTGSEANDIALRIAQSVTGKTGVIATSHTYHGNTSVVSQLSLTNPPPGKPAFNVKYVTAPDSYRPLSTEDGEISPTAFVRELEEKITELEANGTGFSALIVCPFFANEGFPDVNSRWFQPIVKAIKKAGGLIIADEVQPGFGRLGSHFWAHQRNGFIPDIVTLGKPMANGHPVAAVVTTAEHLTSFRTEFRYFNTFGGNPVSCAAAMATLDVLEEESLMANAADVGAYAKASFQELAKTHECIGDVRGAGLFFGAEMVLNREAKEPATIFTKKIANEMRRNGVLINFLGIYYNALKCRPPMCFSYENVDEMIEKLDAVLTKLSPTLWPQRDET